MSSAFICGCAATMLTSDEQALFADARPWGLILFQCNIVNPEQVKALVAAFRAAVGDDDAPVLVDQEGGRVQRLGPPFWPSYPPARSFGTLYQGDRLAGLKAARQVARLIADDLHALGITVNCLPVLDVPQAGSHPVIGNRAYGDQPESVVLLAQAAIAGLMDGGVLPVIKHVPGHGRAMSDSHHELPVVDATLAELRACDFVPFAAHAGATGWRESSGRCSDRRYGRSSPSPRRHAPRRARSRRREARPASHPPPAARDGCRSSPGRDRAHA